LSSLGKTPLKRITRSRAKYGTSERQAPKLQETACVDTGTFGKRIKSRPPIVRTHSRLRVGREHCCQHVTQEPDPSGRLTPQRIRHTGWEEPRARRRGLGSMTSGPEPRPQNRMEVYSSNRENGWFAARAANILSGVYPLTPNAAEMHPPYRRGRRGCHLRTPCGRFWHAGEPSPPI
jgi:hypothetical protein